MTRKILLTALVLGMLGLGATYVTTAAFSSSTSNTGNSFAAGSVYLTDNDASAAMYSVSNKKPGQTAQSCLKVTYGGTLDSTVKIYASSVATVGQYITLTVTSGTQSTPNMDCSTFSADASTPTVYTGTLKNFADTYSSYTSGLADNPLTATMWSNTNAVVYKFDLTLHDDEAANGGASPLSTGSHSFTWEARPQ